MPCHPLHSTRCCWHLMSLHSFLTLKNSDWKRMESSVSLAWSIHQVRYHFLHFIQGQVQIILAFGEDGLDLTKNKQKKPSGPSSVRLVGFQKHQLSSYLLPCFLFLKITSQEQYNTFHPKKTQLWFSDDFQIGAFDYYYQRHTCHPGCLPFIIPLAPCWGAPPDLLPPQWWRDRQVLARPWRRWASGWGYPGQPTETRVERWWFKPWLFWSLDDIG